MNINRVKENINMGPTCNTDLDQADSFQEVLQQSFRLIGWTEPPGMPGYQIVNSQGFLKISS